MNKNILICLEQLGIGGVETAVLNKAIAFKEKGYNVFIAAKNGIYKETLENNGIECIDFEYKLENELNLNDLNNFINIINEKNIGQVHIHHFPCLIYAGFACVITGIPYNVYIHTEVTDVYDWFVNNFSIQRMFMKKLIKSSYKIISITYKAAENNMKYFEIKDKEKYLVERNSLNFNDYKSNKQVNKIEKFLIIARLAEGKYMSIKNGIDLFLEYADKSKNKNVSLKIVGDGSIKSKIEEYIEIKNKGKYEICFCGQTNNVASYIEDSDIVVAIGRCILEAIAMKRIAVISGTENLKSVIDEKNIEDAIDANFNGRASRRENNEIIPEMKSSEVTELVETLMQMDCNRIKEIVNYNYNRVFERLNIKNNSYCISDPIKQDYKNFLLDIFDLANKNMRKDTEIDEISMKKNMEIEQKNAEIKQKNLEIEQINNEKNLVISNQEKIINENNNKIKILEEENEKKNQEINSIINSRRWKISSKLVNFSKKVFRKK